MSVSAPPPPVNASHRTSLGRPSAPFALTTERVAVAALLAIVTAATLILGWASVAQHRAYHSRAYDLGYFDQVIWNTAHGRWFETNFVTFNFLGEHFQPVLLIFAAIYRIAPSVELILVVQSAFVAGAAIPLYIAARRMLASPDAAVLVAAAYLITPQVHWAALFDFHPELLGGVAIFGAVALLVHGRPGWAIVVLCPLAVLKEDAALVGLGFAWLLWLHGARGRALLLAGLAMGYALVIMGVVMPAMRGDGDPGLLLRYGYLGDSPLEVLLGIARHPILVWQQITGDDQRHALAALLAGAALLPLSGPAALMLVPVLVPDLLSTHDAQHALDLHYGFYPAVLTITAALFGITRLARSDRADRVWRHLRVPSRQRATVLAGGLLIASAAAFLFNSPLGGRFDRSTYRRTPHHDAIERVLARVPPGVPLSAQSNLVPHLSQREFIRDFPRIDQAEYVVIDLQSWGIWQTTFEIYREILWSLPSIGFCRIVEDDGVELYQRRADCPTP